MSDDQARYDSIVRDVLKPEPRDGHPRRQRLEFGARAALDAEQHRAVITGRFLEIFEARDVVVGAEAAEEFAQGAGALRQAQDVVFLAAPGGLGHDALDVEHFEHEPADAVLGRDQHLIGGESPEDGEIAVADAGHRRAIDEVVDIGECHLSATFAGEPLGDDNIFACPDGLGFDAAGRIWIQTDIGEAQQNTGDFAQFGNNQMLCGDPRTGEIRRFLTGPVGQEITGIAFTPDGTTMFVNVQHPGATTTEEEYAAGTLKSHWPDGGDAWPRSATVVISKEDGGVVGS